MGGSKTIGGGTPENAWLPCDLPLGSMPKGAPYKQHETSTLLVFGHLKGSSMKGEDARKHSVDSHGHKTRSPFDPL